MTPLHETPQWIVVLLVPLPNGRTNKLPLHPQTLAPHDAHDPTAWTTHKDALEIAAKMGPQFTVGFVLTADDPFWCLDVDGALQPDGTWSALSHDLVAALPNTSVEISQSGKGLHVWGQGLVPPHTMKNVALHIELYTERRFIAIGRHMHGEMTQPCPTIAAVAARYFPPRESAGDTPDDGPRADWHGPHDDDELIRRAMMSRSAASVFGGNRASFADLYHADAAALARAYPPDTNSSEPFDRSSADAALFQHLAFWSGCDQQRMLQLAEGSALKREKWERADYIERTITTACGQQREVLQDKKLERAELPPAPPTAPGMTAAEGVRFLGPAEQVELFKGCIYIAEQHRVLVPGGVAYQPDRFRALFGGYSFVMDARNERTTRNAFEAFTESQVLTCPRVEGTCFRPDLPYGTIIENEGRRRANIWWPAQVRRVVSDITPFAHHLALLFPDRFERECFLYYMANMVQRPGVKAQFFPLLIGVEGNGKSFFSRCMSYAVGQRYTHWPAANKLGKDFNAWLFGKLFYAIEDLKIGESGDVWEKLKPMITGENLEIEGKGVDQRTDEICGNFVANSNHYGAVRATANDRRVMHLHCAQQGLADLARDGITDAYNNGLYDWARADGYAIVSEYLHTLPIPAEFGLAWFMGRAPKTRSAAVALGHSMGRVEQEILEAIGQDHPGFAGGWISSIAVDRLMEKMGRSGAVAPNQRREMLRAMGYEWHPALLATDGRVNNPVAPDAAKTKLYVKSGHLSLHLTLPADVARAYSAAQGAR